MPRRGRRARPAWLPGRQRGRRFKKRSEEHTSELQSQSNLVCRLLLEKKKKKRKDAHQLLKQLAHNRTEESLLHQSYNILSCLDYGTAHSPARHSQVVLLAVQEKQSA